MRDPLPKETPKALRVALAYLVAILLLAGLAYLAYVAVNRPVPPPPGATPTATAKP